MTPIINVVASADELKGDGGEAQGKFMRHCQRVANHVL